jgi:hypothetical protein
MLGSMTPLESFTDITIDVIEEDGLNGYLPTLMIPATKIVRAIAGIPDGVDHRETGVSFMTIVETESGYEVSPQPHCPWWHVVPVGTTG